MYVRTCVNVSIYKYLYWSKRGCDRTWKGLVGTVRLGGPSWVWVLGPQLSSRGECPGLA